MTRFPISFDKPYRYLSSLVLLPPESAFVEVGAEAVSVRMGWAFRSVFPRAAVAAVSQSGNRPISRGVHGFAGRWLVNGSGQGIVDITLAPPQRAYLMGFPIRLRQLLVSVPEPRSLIESLSSAA
jgi:hypothetical protein